MHQPEVSAKSHEGNHQVVGGNWFYYFNCAPGLWRAQLSSISSTFIHIPFNWRFHESNPGQYDFGEQSAERDILQLISFVKELGKTAVIHMPIGPLPGLRNGGVPDFYLGKAATDIHKINYAVIDDQGSLFQFYSYYSPKTYLNFQKICLKVADVLKQIPDKGLIIAASLGGYLVDGIFQAFIEDYSDQFLEGFNRYLRQNQESLAGKNSQQIQNKQDQYHQLMIQLYAESLMDIFASRLIGVIPVVYPDSAPSVIFDKSFGKKNWTARYLDLFEATTSNHLYCPSLIGANNLMSRAQKIIQGDAWLNRIFSSDLYEEDNFDFYPLQFLYIHLTQRKSYENLSSSGLKYFLDTYFGGTMQMSKVWPEANWIEEQQPTLFFSTIDFGMSKFKFLIKYFLSGAKILLDTSLMDDAFRKRMDLFIAENQIQMERINYQTDITSLSLGDSNLLMINLSELRKLKSQEKLKFWEKVFSYISINHLYVDLDKEMSHYWMRRNSRTSELSYLEIRRLILINYGEKTRYARIKREKNFALIKIAQGDQQQVKTSQNLIDVACAPGEIFYLDFGYYDS